MCCCQYITKYSTRLDIDVETLDSHKALQDGVKKTKTRGPTHDDTALKTNCFFLFFFHFYLLSSFDLFVIRSNTFVIIYS